MLRNTDAMPQSGTCDSSKYRCDPPTGYVRPFKKLSCFRLLRGRLCGVCDTPLQSGMCDSSKYRCDSPTGYVRSFEIPMQFPDRVRAALQRTIPFSSPSGPWSDRIRYAPTIGYVRGFKKWICIRHCRWRLWGVCDTPLQLGTCDPSKYRCDLSSGGEGAFGRWGGGGYRLRGRWA